MHSYVVGIIISSTLPGKKVRLAGLHNLAMNIQLMRHTFEHCILFFGLELWKTFSGSLKKNWQQKSWIIKNKKNATIHFLMKYPKVFGTEVTQVK